MKQAPEQLLKIIEPVVDGLGYECVGVEYNPHPQHGMLRVYIDNEMGINLDDCAKVSHQISGVLDVEDPIQSNYQLEISSPGMERPLFSLAHFQRFIGSMVMVNLFKPIEKRRKITGLIMNVVDDLIQLQSENQVLEVPFQTISKARLVPDYFDEKGKNSGK